MTWPTATYRLQFGPHLNFAGAAQLAPYLADLGVSHVYASPVFQARPGSSHGYDVTDYNRLSEPLGGWEGFQAMVAALHQAGLGLILDIVPNHMAASPHNPWFADVLTHGRASPHAASFDIDWNKADGRLVLPVLGAPLEQVLAQGDLSLEDDARFGRALVYYDKRYPLAAGSDGADVAAVLAKQHYVLSFWRDLDRLNYRRFFDITDLIGVRQEDPAVFEASHSLIKELLTDGLVDGLRVDHVDGLRDPKGYLDRLAGLFGDRADPAPNWTPPIWVEKILEGEEQLPATWPVAGETGYAVLSDLDALFVDGAAEPALTRLYETLTGEEPSFAVVVKAAKQHQIATAFAHEFDTLAGQIAARKGLEQASVRAVLEQLALAFPVYRTYLRAAGPCSAERERLQAFARHAREAGADAAVLDAVMTVLSDPAEPAALSFQQMTGPVMAKAVEDTAYYRYVRFIALNEVGGDPDRVGLPAEAFHARMARRAAEQPLALSATATHDTKRGEDVRARLVLLSHDPERWAKQVRGWFDQTREARQGISDRDAYLMFQTALGCWPDSGSTTQDRQALADRLAAYAIKAAREAKLDTAWTEQNPEYETRLSAFARALSEGPIGREIAEAAQDLALAAADISIARLVLKTLGPGIPDVYQGCECPDLSLVDPDNRRPVDFTANQALLRQGGTGPAARKLAATQALLHARREVPSLLRHGSYQPERAPDGTIGFSRRHDNQALSCAVVIRPGAALPAVPPGRPILADPAAWVVVHQTLTNS